MSKKKKFPKFITDKTNIVKRKVPIDDQQPVFSFQRFDIDLNNQYCTNEMCNKEDLNKAFERLQTISNFKWGDIKRGKQFHAHDIETGFKFNTEIEDEQPFQFELFKESRIIGFFDELAVFNIVLIDRKHNVYQKN